MAHTSPFAITVMADPTKLVNPSHENYLVGWISPSRVDYTMALRMLHEEHERIGQNAAGYNVYTLAE